MDKGLEKKERIAPWYNWREFWMYDGEFHEMVGKVNSWIALWMEEMSLRVCLNFFFSCWSTEFGSPRLESSVRRPGLMILLYFIIHRTWRHCFEHCGALLDLHHWGICFPSCWWAVSTLLTTTKGVVSGAKNCLLPGLILPRVIDSQRLINTGV